MKLVGVITCNHESILSLYIVYETKSCSNDLGADFLLGNALFGAVKSTKNADPDKYTVKYSGYSIGFDACLAFSLSSSHGFDKNVKIFEVDNSSSTQPIIERQISNFLIKVQQMD